MIDKSAALKAIAKHPWTALVTSAAGQLFEIVSFDSQQPTPESIMGLAKRQTRGMAFRLVQQAQLTEQELDELIEGMVREANPPWALPSHMSPGPIECSACGTDMVDTGRRGKSDLFAGDPTLIMLCPSCCEECAVTVSTGRRDPPKRRDR